MKYDTNTRIEELEIMGDMMDELAADLAAQQGEETEILPDEEIKTLLYEDEIIFLEANEYTLEDAQRDFCVEPFEDYDYEDWN